MYVSLAGKEGRGDFEPPLVGYKDMTVLFWGSVVWGLSFLFHIVVWKIHLPHRQTRALLLIFGGGLAVSLAGLACTVGFQDEEAFPRPDSLAQYLHLGLFHLALTLAYVITYSALEADSPSLVLILSIDQAGEKGLSREEIQRMCDDDLLVRPRIADALRDGLVCRDGPLLKLTSKGAWFISLFLSYRRLIRAPKGG